MNNYISQKIIIFSFIFLFAGFVFSSLAEATPTSGDAVVNKIPSTIDEAKTIGKNILNFLPNLLKNLWFKILELLENIFFKIRNFYITYIERTLINIRDKVKIFLNQKVEEKKPEIEKEIQKQTQEIKEEIPKTGKNLWERFKELINI